MTGRVKLFVDARPRATLPVLVAVLALGVTSHTRAASLPTGCTQSAQTVTCTYTSGSNPFTVPSGVSSIHVFAVGGMGGASIECPMPGVCTQDVAGGFGAAVSGTLPLSPGTTLYAVVGANGGGGVATAGGGASDVRTSQSNVSSRVLVAAGGGGAGAPGTIQFGTDVTISGGGGVGGAAGAPGAPGAPASWPSTDAGGGSAASSTGGGAGGSAGIVTNIGNCSPVCTGDPGTAGAVGTGGLGGRGGDVGEPGHVSLGGGDGGGGGGGLFGGGGGGGGSPGAGGAGGGGGSNLVPSGGTQRVDTTGVPLVEISYAAVKDPTSTAVSCSPNKGNGRRVATCTATVTDIAAGAALTPTGTVFLFTRHSLSHGHVRHCALTAGNGASASCSVIFLSGRKHAPARIVTAIYGGDSEHLASLGKTVLRFGGPPTKLG